MTIAQRLYLLIFTAIVGLASLAGLGLLQIEKVFTVTNFTNVNTVPSLLALDEAFIPAAVLRVQVWQYLALSDAEKKSGLANEMALACQSHRSAEQIRKRRPDRRSGQGLIGSRS